MTRGAHGRGRRRRLLIWLAVGVSGAGLASAPLLGDRRAHADDHAPRPARAHGGGVPQLPRADTTVAVSAQPFGRPIPAGFVGLSFEYPAVIEYAGSSPEAVNPVLEQLIRNLAPGQAPVVRIGGDSTDTTWWPTPGLRPPPGVTYSLSSRWLAVVGALARHVGARLILGVDLEAGRPALAAAEAHAFLTAFATHSLRALEIGNEAARYNSIPWYHAGPGRPVFARPPGYGFAAFNAEFAKVARLMPREVPLAGPTAGGYDWLRHLPQFLASQPRVGLVTFHRYPLDRCFTSVGSPTYPTLPRLLSSASSRGLASGISPYVVLTHRHHLGFRVDEMNSVACGGKRGVSNAFASALWAADALFAMARAGVDGVNVHTFRHAVYGLFSFRRTDGRWLATVRPEYYGLLMFAQAAPPRSRLMRLALTGSAAVRAWATRAADGTLRVLLINDDLKHRHVVLLRTPTRRSSAAISLLTAPSADATKGVTLGGRSFGLTDSGVLGPLEISAPPSPSAGQYEVTLREASAALVTIRASAGGAGRPVVGRSTSS